AAGCNTPRSTDDRRRPAASWRTRARRSDSRPAEPARCAGRCCTMDERVDSTQKGMRSSESEMRNEFIFIPHFAFRLPRSKSILAEQLLRRDHAEDFFGARFAARDLQHGRVAELAHLFFDALGADLARGRAVGNQVA